MCPSTTSRTTCAEVRPRPDPAAHARRLASVFAPPEQRALLEKLLAVEAEISASARPGLDHGVAHARLAYWREECARAAGGRASHPLLRAALEASPAPARLAGLAGLVTNVEWDLACATFETQAELDAWLGRWAQAIIAPLYAAAGAAPELADAAAALREAELLGTLAAELQAGRLRLPLDALAAAGVDPGSLRAPPWPDALVTLLRPRHARVQARLAALAAGTPPPARYALRGVLVWSQVARAHSARAARALPQEFHPGLLAGFADTLRAWQTALATGGAQDDARAE